MSALGQKHTFRSAITMSALPPKGDVTVRHCHRGVRCIFVIIGECRTSRTGVLYRFGG